MMPKIARNAVLILDNAKIHRAELLNGTWKMIKATYGTDVLFLPPYSPFLNPIELSFNTLKNAVARKDMYDRGDLLDSIRNCIPTSVTSDNAKEWITHCTRFYPQYAMDLPFRGKMLSPDITDPNNINEEQVV